MSEKESKVITIENDVDLNHQEYDLIQGVEANFVSIFGAFVWAPKIISHEKKANNNGVEVSADSTLFSIGESS